MRRSTTSFLFPDLNVWLALSVQSHIHHRAAAGWLEQGNVLRLCFCRFTQMGLLRLLTTIQLMGAEEVLTQQQAWRAYDQWLADERVVFLEEPVEMEVWFRKLTQLEQAAPKDWADSYLIAFAHAAGLQLVTFDKAMARKTPQAVLLAPSR